MRLAICQCDPGGTVNVQGPNYGANFARGAQVDLDAKVAPGVDTTWAAALGPYVSLFGPVEFADSISMTLDPGLEPPDGFETPLIDPAQITPGRSTLRRIKS